MTSGEWDMEEAMKAVARATRTTPGRTARRPYATRTTPGRTACRPETTRTASAATARRPEAARTTPGRVATRPETARTAPGATASRPEAARTIPGRAARTPHAARAVPDDGQRASARRRTDHPSARRCAAALMTLVLGLGASAAVAQGYGVRPGDVLAISVWGEDEMAREVLVRPDGGISYPLAGDLNAEGHTVVELQEEIAARLSKYIPEPLVTVAVQQIQGNAIYVLGKVNRPGVFVMNGATDVMQALSLAGGTATFADLKKINVLRRDGGSQRAIPFNYAEVEQGRDLQQNILLEPGDVVVVP